MGSSKVLLFSTEQNEMAAVAKAIGHPARIAILQYLLASNSCVNGHLVEELGLAQSTVSQHLKALKAAQLIQGTICGTAVSYCIDPIGWASARALLIGLLGQGSHQLTPSLNCNSITK